MTTRWTTEERLRLDWLSNQLGVELSNVPRTLLWQFFGNNPELQDKYSRVDIVRERLPERTYSTDPVLNQQVQEKMSEFCQTIEQANDVMNCAAEYCSIEAYNPLAPSDFNRYSSQEESKEAFMSGAFALAILRVMEEKERIDHEADYQDQLTYEFLKPLGDFYAVAKVLTKEETQRVKRQRAAKASS